MKSVLIGLDLTEMDINLVKYASVISKDLDFQNIYFLHVAKHPELPGEIMNNRDVSFQFDKENKQKIEANVDEYFKTKEVNISIEVQEGNQVEKILKFSKDKNIDLIIFGRKENLRGSGLLSDTIVRKSPCNILLIPESQLHQSIKKIIVPVDFSRHSEKAVEKAIEIKKNEGASVKCVNIYTVPSGYSKYGKTYEEFVQIMKRNSEDDFKAFAAHFDEPLECDFIHSSDHDYDEELMNYIHKAAPDIVIIGSKGRTNTSVILLGSMAEKLTKRLSSTALFIIKEKGESLNFFEALLRL